MRRYSLDPIGQAFDQGMDEVGSLLALLLVLIIIGLIVAVSQAVVEYKRRNAQADFGPWEEPADASGVWFPDASLHLGEVVEWQ